MAQRKNTRLKIGFSGLGSLVVRDVFSTPRTVPTSLKANIYLLHECIKSNLLAMWP